MIAQGYASGMLAAFDEEESAVKNIRVDDRLGLVLDSEDSRSVVGCRHGLG